GGTARGMGRSNQRYGKALVSHWRQMRAEYFVLPRHGRWERCFIMRWIRQSEGILQCQVVLLFSRRQYDREFTRWLAALRRQDTSFQHLNLAQQTGRHMQQDLGRRRLRKLKIKPLVHLRLSADQG